MEIEELKKKLRKKISQIRKIEVLAKECFNFTFYLNKPETPEEIQYLKKSREFKFISEILWRMSVIELSKLFRYREDYNYKKINEKFNIQCLVQKFKENGEFVKLGISNNSISKWETELLINEKSIKNITFLRDKIYAHTDELTENIYNIELTFDDLRNLIMLAESIIGEIYFEIFETDAISASPIFDDIDFNIIRILAEEENKRFETLKGSLGLS